MALKIEKILKLKQEQLLEKCCIKLLNTGYSVNDILYTDDYVYAKGRIPVLLVAHCDIVHKDIPKTILYDRQLRMLWSPTGIGGDDRCGVYAILKICEKYRPYVLFTTDEEKGGLGVRKFTEEIDELPVNFIIEIDRRGDKQAVFYECQNKEFQNYILSFGFDKKIGSYSDVSTLSTTYDIAGVNLSAGYYNEHTDTEYINLNHLDYTISKIEQILKDTKHHKFYDCQQVKLDKKKKYYKYYYDDYYDDYYGYNTYEKEEDKQNENDKLLEKENDYYILTNEEWVKKYGFKKPESIVDIY